MPYKYCISNKVKEVFYVFYDMWIKILSHPGEVVEVKDMAAGLQSKKYHLFFSLRTGG